MYRCASSSPPSATSVATTPNSYKVRHRAIGKSILHQCDDFGCHLTRMSVQTHQETPQSAIFARSILSQARVFLFAQFPADRQKHAQRAEGLAPPRLQA